jgi:hypothetical protein
MQPVYITDPAWRTTFQHLVAPLPNEWLLGLLLRCDEVNDWNSGTTFTLFRHSINWSGAIEHMIAPSSLDCTYLS